jgi:hypothetical protein
VRARRHSAGRALGAAVGLLIAALALGAPGAASANDAGSITHTVGPTTATLSWGAAEFGVVDPKLSVVRDGVPYAITIDDVCLEGCVVVADDPAHPADSVLQVADLDGDGEPEILADFFSGGAHCCVTARLLTWNGAGYTAKDINYGDVGYTLEDADGDGRPELVGYDPVFSGAFTAFAGSLFPPQVLRVDHGAIIDITRQFPALVRTDAKARLRDLRKAKRGDDLRGVLAAYVADEYLLGRGTVGKAEIDHQHRAGRVTAGFKALLLRRLKAWGYR